MELVAPAGNLEKLTYAYEYGADAAYIGLKRFSLRVKADNFYEDEYKKIIELKNNHPGKKLFCALNITFHNKDIQQFISEIDYFKEYPIDSFIVQDIGMVRLIQKYFPKAALHLSTQANCINSEAVKMYRDLGFKRVVLGREASLAEIRQIKDAVPEMELEVFGHGAMCVSYSGRCLLSAFLTGRDGNRGACAQACRWDYTIMEKNRPGEQFDIQEDERGTYIMNSKDLCLIDYLPELMRAGVCSLKIEGRMKSVHYVATVVSTYRKAIDSCFANIDKYKVRKAWREELEKVSHRPYTTGFALGKPDENSQVYTTSSYEQTHDFVGIVTGYDVENKRALFEQRNNVKEGEVLELLMPDGKLLEVTLADMRNADGEHIDCAPHAQMKFSIACDVELLPCSLLRRKVK